MDTETTDQSKTPHITEPSDYFKHGVHVSRAYTIQRSPGELFRFWRDFTNLPKFMKHVESVTVLDQKRSHWKVRAPAGQHVEWDAEIINEETDKLLAWRSLDGADVESAGSVRFVDTGDRGTEVRVVLDYIPPAGKVGKLIAQLFGKEPGQQITDDLRHFKQLMEAGEIPTSEGTRGDCKGR